MGVGGGYTQQADTEEATAEYAKGERCREGHFGASAGIAPQSSPSALPLPPSIPLSVIVWYRLYCSFSALSYSSRGHPEPRFSAMIAATRDPAYFPATIPSCIGSEMREGLSKSAVQIASQCYQNGCEGPDYAKLRVENARERFALATSQVRLSPGATGVVWCDGEATHRPGVACGHAMQPAPVHIGAVAQPSPVETAGRCVNELRGTAISMLRGGGNGRVGGVACNPDLR